MLNDRSDFIAAPAWRNWRRAGRRSWIAIGAILLIALGLAFVGLAYAVRTNAAPQQSTAGPSANAPLIISPRSVALAASLSGGLRLVGTLYPSYPGRNTLHLRIVRDGRAVVPSHPLRLAITMPGMAMRPILVDLLPSGRQVSGLVVLPMFGAYRADVVFQTARGRATGSLFLVLNLTNM